MNSIIVTLTAAIKIFILDIVLCGDNVGVIALATRNLSKEHVKKASAVGIFLSVVLRMFFASIITLIIAIQWLPVKLVGGIILVKITWDFIKPQQESEDIHVKQADKFWTAVLSILIADLTMSLDNVLAIASAAKGDIKLIILGLTFSIPILFFGSQFVTMLMRKYIIVVYIGGSILAHTSFSMILEDKLISKYLNPTVGFLIPILAALVVFVYGLYIMRKNKKENEADEDERLSS
jgi:YjbE family integral membrane protein